MNSKLEVTRGCTRKFTIHIYINSYSYFPHIAKLQTLHTKSCLKAVDAEFKFSQVCYIC